MLGIAKTSRQRYGSALVVFGVVVGIETIRRDLLVTLVVVYVYLCASVRFLVGGVDVLFQHRILLYLLFYTLFELDSRKLQQLDHLYLLW